MSDAHAAPDAGAANGSAREQTAEDRVPETPAQIIEAEAESQKKFDDAFAEAAAKVDGKDPAAVATTSDPVVEAAPAVVVADGDRPRDPKTGQFAAPGAKKPAAAAPAAAPDPWSKAAPELVQARDAAVEAATAGHREQIARRTRENDRLKERLAALEKPGATAPRAAAPAKPAGGTPAAAAAPTGERAERLKKLREEYGEVADPLLAEIDATNQLALKTQQENAALQTRLAAIEGRETERTTVAEVNEQVAALEDEHPDWRDLTGEPGSKLAEADKKLAATKFIDWLDTQPAFVREAAKRNGERIVDAESAALMIRLYKADLGIGPKATAAKPGEASGDATPPSAPTRQTPPDPRRANQLRGSSTVPARGPGAASAPPDDFESAFQHYAKKTG